MFLNRFLDNLDHLNTQQLGCSHYLKLLLLQPMTVPSFIKSHLHKKSLNDNVFTGDQSSRNPDYFKTLWSRYKKQTKLLKQGQTLYSFRHSGAIEIFKRTGSLTKLQKAMGHSSINVSLTYFSLLFTTGLEQQKTPQLRRVFRVVPLGLEPRTL